MDHEAIVPAPRNARRTISKSASVARDLRPQRADALSPREVDMLEKLIGIEHALEFLVAHEVVLASVLLAFASFTRGRRHRECELRHTRHQRSFERSLPGTRRAGD